MEKRQKQSASYSSETSKKNSDHREWQQNVLKMKMCSSRKKFFFCLASQTTQEIPVQLYTFLQRFPPSPRKFQWPVEKKGIHVFTGTTKTRRGRGRGRGRNRCGMPAKTTPFFILPINFTLFLLCHLSRKLLIIIFKLILKRQVQECSLIIVNVLLILIVCLENHYFHYSERGQIHLTVHYGVLFLGQSDLCFSIMSITTMQSYNHIYCYNCYC